MEIEMMSSEDITKLLENFKNSTHYDDVIENLIRNGNLYGILEKIVDGTLDKKFIKSMFPLLAKSEAWNDFYVLLEIGVMDGMLSLTDIKSSRSKAKKQRK